MPISTTQTFTSETGEQAMVTVPTDHNVAVYIESGGSDDIDIEVQAPGDTTRFKVETALNGNVVRKVAAPIRAVGIDIDANVSNSITVHYVSTKT